MGSQPGISVSYGASCAGVALIHTYCLGRWALGRISTAGLLAPDHNGSVLGHYPSAARLRMAYTPYGYRAERSGLPAQLGFNGQRQDSLTGCYHLGAGRRVFSPVLMRFNRPDELSPFGEGGLNCYAYCVGDPINAVDPSGQFPFFSSLLGNPFTKWRDIFAGGEPSFLKSTRYHRTQDIVKTEQAFPGLTNAKSHGRGAISFSDQGRFYLSAHGNPSGNISFGSRVMSPGRAYRKLLKADVDIARHDSVYLMVCYSAGGENQGPVKRFAQLTGLPVTGNVGEGWDNGITIAKFIRSGVPADVAEQYARGHYRILTSYVDHAPANPKLRYMAEYTHNTTVFRP
jgi:RHS repeat-associated protein